MTTARRPRIAAAAAALALTALALTGCSGQEAGSAATLGDSRITQTALSAEVQAVLEAKGQSPTTADETLPPEILGRMITIRLVDELAAREGVTVTQGQIDEQIANALGQLGDQAAVEEYFAQQNVAPSQIESIVKLQVQAQQLGLALAPEGSAEEQGKAVFDAVVALSDELGTTVSPRYGTWDGASLSVGPVPNDLSTPPTAG